MSVNKVNSDGSLLRVAGGTLYADAPIGSIVPFGGSAVPSGFLLCDGAEVLKTAYAELYTVIGDAFGAASDATKFVLPDLRETVPVGSGLRGSDVTAHDTYTLGQFKDDQLQGHSHATGKMALGSGGYPYGVQGNGIQPLSDPWYMSMPVKNPHVATDYGTPRYGTTTHGKQLGVNYIIKAKQVALPLDIKSTVEDMLDEVAADIDAIEAVIPSNASSSNKLALRREIYILSNQYSGATYNTVEDLLAAVAADMLAKGGYGGAVGCVWTGKSYFSGTYGTNGSTAGHARLHFENAQDGYTECSFSFTSSGLGTVTWFNDATTSSVTSGSTAPVTSGGIASYIPTGTAAETNTNHFTFNLPPLADGDAYEITVSAQQWNGSIGFVTKYIASRSGTNYRLSNCGGATGGFTATISSSSIVTFVFNSDITLAYWRARYTRLV